ncbi:unnamed protein product [marine sediment metagenome]|uniref:Laminin G domain-containing protein n=1 Tax=marine sediment metagenome TaxID=412755 RepID=X1M0L7_9ZZZZ
MLIPIYKPNWLISDSFTIEAWAKTGSIEVQLLYSLETAGKEQVWLEVDSGGVKFNLRDDSWNNTLVEVLNDYTDSKWHHFAVVRDTSTDKVILYVDGQKAAEVTDNAITTINTVSQRRFFIGALNHSGGTTSYFNGEIGKFAVYKQALSAEEIKNHYDMCKP